MIQSKSPWPAITSHWHCDCDDHCVHWRCPPVTGTFMVTAIMTVTVTVACGCLAQWQLTGPVAGPRQAAPGLSPPALPGPACGSSKQAAAVPACLWHWLSLLQVAALQCTQPLEAALSLNSVTTDKLPPGRVAACLVLLVPKQSRLCQSNPHWFPKLFIIRYNPTVVFDSSDTQLHQDYTIVTLKS
jgi:hypothetical protein